MIASTILRTGCHWTCRERRPVMASDTPGQAPDPIIHDLHERWKAMTDDVQAQAPDLIARLRERAESFEKNGYFRKAAELMREAANALSAALASPRPAAPDLEAEVKARDVLITEVWDKAAKFDEWECNQVRDPIHAFYSKRKPAAPVMPPVDRVQRCAHCDNWFPVGTTCHCAPVVPPVHQAKADRFKAVMKAVPLSEAEQMPDPDYEAVVPPVDRQRRVKSAFCPKCLKHELLTFIEGEPGHENYELICDSCKTVYEAVVPPVDPRTYASYKRLVKMWREAYHELRSALERIEREDPECTCDHTDEYCCARTSAVFCARCYAAKALAHTEAGR